MSQHEHSSRLRTIAWNRSPRALLSTKEVWQMRRRTSEAQALLGERLTALYETILTEPLPKRWVPLIHALNAREKAEREATRPSQMRPTARAERYQSTPKLPL